jgi:rubredoxin
VVGVVVMQRAAREDPCPTHEALPVIALHEQHLRSFGAVAQEHERGRLSRRSDLALHGRSLPLLYAPFMSETLTSQQWICTSCGFIYDPADGDPDGGIPSGTAFEDIPDDWFCPVCGARKKDFEKYEG